MVKCAVDKPQQEAMYKQASLWASTPHIRYMCERQPIRLSSPYRRLNKFSQLEWTSNTSTYRCNKKTFYMIVPEFAYKGNQVNWGISSSA